MRQPPLAPDCADEVPRADTLTAYDQNISSPICACSTQKPMELIGLRSPVSCFTSIRRVSLRVHDLPGRVIWPVRSR
jgi:hypothetical protein